MTRIYVMEPFLDRIRDWDWHLQDLVTYFWDTIGYHIDRLGLWGYVLVPAAIWFAFLVFPPTRYAASRGLVSFVGNTFGTVFRSVTGGFFLAVQRLLGLGIAAMRSGLRSLFGQLPPPK